MGYWDTYRHCDRCATGDFARISNVNRRLVLLYATQSRAPTSSPTEASADQPSRP